MTIRITALCHYAECRYGQVLLVVMLRGQQHLAQDFGLGMVRHVYYLAAAAGLQHLVYFFTNL